MSEKTNLVDALGNMRRRAVAPGEWGRRNTQWAVPAQTAALLALVLGAETTVSPALAQVDEVYQGRDPTFNTILNDVARVEVLRGPQGTLYGKNTIGGAINIVTQEPTNEFDAFGDFTYGNLDLVQLRGTLSGPIVEDKLMTRLSLVYRDRDGFLDNTFTGDKLNDTEAWGGRLVIASELTDSIRLRLSGDYFKEEGTDALELESLIPAPGPFTPAFLSSFPPQDPLDNVIALDKPDFAMRELYGVAGRIDWDLGGSTLTSITAYREYTSSFHDDSDALPFDAFDVGREENAENFSQELRLTSTTESPFTWILGAYYYVENIENVRDIRTGPDFPFFLAGVFAPIFFPGYVEEMALTSSTIESSSYAFFGSATYEILDGLHLAGGLRWTHEQKDFFYRQFHTLVDPGGSIIGAFAVPIGPVTEDYKDGRLTGDASISYDFTDDHVGYFRYARGFKAGGFQTDVISPPFDPADPLGFDPETVNNYEVGFKSYWLDRKLSLNLAAFYLDWKDKQEQIFTGLSFLIRNAAVASSRGAEVEFVAKPVDGLTFDFNAAYLYAKYDEFPTNPDREGQVFFGLPRWSGSAGLEYVSPPIYNSGVELYARGDVIYRSDINRNTAAPIIDVNEEITTFNARAGVQDPDGHWGLYLWGRNLSDEVRVGGGNFFPFPFATIQTRGPALGRTYGVELRLHN